MHGNYKHSVFTIPSDILENHLRYVLYANQASLQRGNRLTGLIERSLEFSAVTGNNVPILKGWN
jgi:hypothetical protein